MVKIKMTPNTYVLAIVVSFVIAAIAFSPALLEGEIDYRILVGILWSLLGALWWKRLSNNINFS
jgi:hypothetical protein